MSYHIVHLLSRDLPVNLRRDQLQITKKKDGTLPKASRSPILRWWSRPVPVSIFLQQPTAHGGAKRGTAGLQ